MNEKKKNTWEKDRSAAAEVRDRRGDVWSVSGSLCGECNQQKGEVHHYSESEA